ncbi:MAG: TetR/AcrR family transcriptional regulator [Peptoniphilus harei]|nr:TetR/AcrR family transcriptional regulator [Peptoniphilus harei]MDU4046615.1 TetR/AcrR family transcriptional regulator [Peptoniphilus harei]MDU5467578.1 TetR/AcrR family transcriptional regulator [Peptoniphilus harei]
MAKKTFENLEKEKKEKIYNSLKEFFEEEDLKNINVSGIVKKLNIARGSFYQYFEDLEDSYFTVLKKETGEIHHKFFNLYKENKEDMGKTLKAYRDFLATELYDKNLKNLYRPKFFIFENSFMTHGKNFLREHLSDNFYHKMTYIMAVFHELIKESIRRDYDKEKFLEVCNLYINWLLGGINNESI